MSLEVLESIQAAEQKAESIRHKAQQEARDMLKSVEGACAARERSAAVQLRSLYQTLLDDRRKQVEEKLDAVRLKKSAERAAFISKAETHLDEAASVIFERVIKNGDR